MVLSFLVSAVAVIAVVVFALLFEFVAEHLSSFLKLALTRRAAFALVVSPFIAGGFPAFESLCHFMSIDWVLYEYSIKLIWRSQVGSTHQSNSNFKTITLVQN
jgi:hypothetical protein